jgi:RND family efflux transporter MFP subunit
MKKNLILALGVLAIALTVSGCAGRKKAAAVEEAPKVTVKVATAVSEVIPSDVEFTANIEPWQKNYIVPALQGARIRSIYVEVGDRVRKGQLVAEMDPTQYNQVKVQYETAKADYERIEKVHQAGGVSDQQLQQAETQYLVYKENYVNVAKNVKLVSPIDGVVTQKLEEEGNLFTTNPILEIMQMDKLKVKVNISEQYFRFVKVGTEVRLEVDIFPGETFAGSVSLIYPAIDPATRTFMVEVTIPNESNKLRPGMFARCVINMGDKEAVMVPDIAVQKQVGTNERFVYVIKNGVALRHTVTVGRLIGGRYDVLSGVEAGDELAVTSFSKISDGSEVEVAQ